LRKLQGLGVLVTRPEQQAMPLCRLLEAEGAVSFRLPAIEIKPTSQQRSLSAHLGPLDRFDLIVFTSANAVRFGAQLLAQRRDLTLGAVGLATARALNQAGYRVAIVPEGRADSEGLLEHPRLQHVTGKRVLLVKGVGGRELLADELTARGAAVVAAEVYERRAATPGAAQLAMTEEGLRSGQIQVITATSAEVGLNLLAMAGLGWRAALERAHWLVASARIAATLKEQGVAAPMLTAATAEDQDLVAALVAWRASASGA
jgi:uroporphyrinogen-III synthase